MMKKVFKVLFVAFLICFLSAGGTRAIACGPSFPVPIFTFSIRPENFADFAEGKIGIIQPDWHRSMLLVAYRELNDLPFSDNEQKDLVSNWQAEYEMIDANEASKNAAIENWLAERNKVLTEEPEPKIYALRKSENGYDYFLNCTAGAFENAGKTLAERITDYKINDDVKDWVRAQDDVFANCSETRTMPAEASADSPIWLKNDRDYQIAAAQFYAMHYDEAKDRFVKIAQNSASEWNQLAAYLLARVAVRQASTFAGEDAGQAQALYKQAIEQINAVLANGQLSSYHPAAMRLLNFVNFRLHPEQLHDSLAKKLLAKEANADFFQDLTDYRRLLDKAEVEDQHASAEVKALYEQFRQTSDLTDWIFTLQSSAPDVFAHAFERWQTTKNDAWLVASLIKAPAGSPEADALISASQAINRDSAAFLTANYHAVRLQMAQGQADAARKTLDAILTADKLTLSKSTSSQLYSQRMLLAQNVDEFVKYAQRRAAVFAYSGSNYELIDAAKPAEGEDYNRNEREWLQRTMFDADAAYTLNLHTPLSLLKKIAPHPDLPDYLKRRVVMSVWTRAVLLGDDQTALEFVPHVVRYLPELKDFMSQYGKAKDKQGRAFEAVWLMLKNPGMRPLVEQGQGRLSAFNEIDNFRDNWWCDADFDPRFFNNQGIEVANFPAPAFFTQAEIAEAATENAKIAALTGGANFLATQTVQWAKQQPNEKRLPEALHMAVKATRYGCQNCATGKASKAAFNVLTKRFKTTEWKKKTPYWFGEACAKK
ncbi:MAG: hypothetical protein ACU88J_03685 [Gammaproteobacteria bacterium]